MNAEEAADEYAKELFKLNPDGFHVAPWCNEDTLSDAFIAGVEWANFNPGPEPVEEKK
jgi:hypothetical protein